MEISPSYNLVIPPLPIYILLSVSSPACTVLLSLKPTIKTVTPSGGHGRPPHQLSPQHSSSVALVPMAVVVVPCNGQPQNGCPCNNRVVLCKSCPLRLRRWCLSLAVDISVVDSTLWFNVSHLHVSALIHKEKRPYSRMSQCYHSPPPQRANVETS